MPLHLERSVTAFQSGSQMLMKPLFPAICNLKLSVSLQKQLDGVNKQVAVASKEVATMDLMQQLEEAGQDLPAACKEDDVYLSNLKSQYEQMR